ncbi:chromatin structure-remodeling complex protein Rsc6p [[Candida] anglica]
MSQAHAMQPGAQGMAARPRENPAPAPIMSYTPTDITIPTALYNKIPNLELYKKLQDAERKIDLLTTRKALDFQGIQTKTTHPSSYQKQTGILRVFVYNTCENQPWQKQLAQEKGIPVADPSAESSWTLRVEGRFLNDKGEPESSASAHSFSSFLSGISVDLVPNDNYPNLQNSQSNVIEWRDQSLDHQPDMKVASSGRQAAFDGLDVKRNGVFKIKCNIALLPKIQSSFLQLSTPMAQFVGKQECSQQEVIYTIWSYVLYNDLLKKSDSYTNVPALSVTGGNGVLGNDDNSDLTVVECDATLRKLLNVPSFRFTDLYKVIQPHFKPREPIVLSYEIDTGRSTTLGDVIIDIPVDLPSTLSEFQQGVIESSKAIFEKLTASDALIQNLNTKISLGVVALQNSNARELFYRELSEDPVKFMENWIQSQSETFKVLKSDEGYDEEVVRRAEYYEKNEHILRENINLLLGSGKI